MSTLTGHRTLTVIYTLLNGVERKIFYSIYKKALLVRYYDAYS